jgi:hypothetical protein
VVAAADDDDGAMEGRREMTCDVAQDDVVSMICDLAGKSRSAEIFWREKFRREKGEPNKLKPEWISSIG